jgi:uncharacterized damage-inducible protein DinB
MMIGPTFTNAAANTLTLYAERIGVCLDRLTAEQIWARASDNENAIGNLVLHLAGNLRQYTRHAILGEPDIRTRDDEFNSTAGDALSERLATVVADAASIIRAVTDERLAERIIVQNREMTVLEAIFKTTEHFALHTGQIMSATKRATSAPLGFTTHNRKPEV